jgi:hypothetical protein
MYSMNKWCRNINICEMDWLFDHGYTITSKWISPNEGYEYRLHKLGQEKVLAYRKSERACYNYAVRLIDKM